MAKFILSEYVKMAMEQAEYDKLADHSFFGRIEACKGAIAFASTLRDCEEELQSVLEDWILLGLKMKHPLPIHRPYNTILERKTTKKNHFFKD